MIGVFLITTGLTETKFFSIDRHMNIQNYSGFGVGDGEEDHFNSSVDTRSCSLSATSSGEHQTEVPARQSSQKTPSKRKSTKWQ